MTTPSHIDAVLERLRPIVDRIAAGAVEREQRNVLPREQVRWLVDAGFPALRVPVERGGAGLTLPELARVLTELGAADSNLPQIFRGHIAFVEDRLTAPDSADRDAWLERFVAGELVGNAWSEVGTGALGRPKTTVTRHGGSALLNGSKYYTTGSIYADWADVTARDAETGADVSVLVRTDQPGVRISDDWDGFGQQLTGTGTIVFTDAVVDAAEVRPFQSRFRYQTALYQFVLLTVLAGIASAVEADAGEQIRSRQRVYSHGNASLTRDDPQILAVAGEISAAAFVADATVQHVAELLQVAFETSVDRDSARDAAANVAAEIGAAQGQVVLSELVPGAATRLFDTLGASGVSRARDLDRHWRNARTVVSHNPWLFKSRIVGDWSVNGTPPPFVWQIGIDRDARATAPAR